MRRLRGARRAPRARLSGDGEVGGEKRAGHARPRLPTVRARVAAPRPHRFGPRASSGPVPPKGGAWGRNQTSSGTPSFAAAFAARYREHAGPDVSLTKCEGGDVDNYRATPPRGAASCGRKLAWHEPARACKSARSLSRGARPTSSSGSCARVRGSITRARARALRRASRKRADLAEADATDISAALYDAAAFDPARRSPAGRGAPGRVYYRRRDARTAAREESAAS